MKKIVKFIFPALILSLSLTACGMNSKNEKNIKETQKESSKETHEENNMEMTHQGIYLGNGLYLDKMINEEKDTHNLLYIKTPENFKLEIGKTYEYEVSAIQESMPGQTTVEKIKEIENKEIVKINEMTASMLLEYANTDNKVNLIYQSADNIIKDSLEYNNENIEKLNKDGILISYGKDSDKLAKTLKDEGFKLVFDLGDDKDIKELETK